jgi:hypothetical protein
MSFNNVSTPNLLYYDIQISNIENQNTKPPVLTFIETRNNPFIYDTNQYEMSVIRFVLDTPNLPVFIPTIQPAPNTDIDLTIYSVSLQWNNPVAPFQTFTQQTYVRYIPQSLVPEVPPPPTLTDNGLQYNDGQYYYIYNYQYFIFLINNAFINCFNALNAQVVGAGLVLPTIHPPVMSFDTATNTAIINCDLLGYNTASPTNQIGIFFNTPLSVLFSSFPVKLLSIVSNLGLNAQIITNSFQLSNVIQYPPFAPVYNAIQVFQEFSTITLWCPISSIVFTSQTLPIVSNQISTPILFNNSGVLANNGNNSLIAQTITDFVANDALYKPQLIYVPQAEYRMIELISNRPLNTFDISVFWKDKQTGALIPFFLSSGASATIKVLFRKKAKYQT